jgi:hypothetical protein
MLEKIKFENYNINGLQNLRIWGESCPPKLSAVPSMQGHQLQPVHKR